LKVPRSTIPAVTHVDSSARVQTVTAADNPAYHRLLSAFKQATGCPVLVNTSFNVRGEPIVNTPADAYTCFMRTNIDLLAIGGFLLEKPAQPPWREDGDWRAAIPLD
jgi:carbamoyltransferase